MKWGKAKEKWLDELIYRIIGSGRPQFDAGSWKDKYAEEFELLKSFSQDKKSLRASMLLRFFRNPVTGISVAAVVLVTILVISSVVYKPSREDAVKKSVSESPVAKVVDEDKGAGISTEDEALLQKVRKMIADGDVEGLTKVFSEGRFAEKVLAAASLAEMGDERALRVLEKLYSLAKDDVPEGELTKVLESAIEEIKQRAEEEQVKVEDEEETEEEAEKAAEAVLDFRVVDKATKSPIGGVKLKIMRDGVHSGGKTDEQGRFKIEIGKETPDFMSVRAYPEGYVPMIVEFKPKGDISGIPKSYTLEVERGTLIGGIVQAEDGFPIEGAKVYVRLLGGGDKEKVWLWDPYFETDAQGRWQCDIAPAELWGLQLRLVHLDYVSDEQWEDRKVPPEAELRSQRSVMVMKSGFTIVGKVLDMDGRPIKGAKVHQGTEQYAQFFISKETDEEGRFEFGARPGVITLTARADGYETAQKGVEVGEDMEEVEFRLNWALTIAAQVVDSSDRPIEGASVETSGQQDIASLRWSSVTDSNGYFEWTNAPAAKVYFDIRKAGYLTIWRTPLVSAKDAYTIMMYPQLQINGSVVDADSGEPVESFELIPGLKWGDNVDVSWQRWQGARPSGGFYEHKFEYVCEGYFIRVEADGYKPVVSRQFYADEGSVRFDFKLEKGIGPEGRVYLSDGSPAVSAQVILATPSQLAYLHNGRFGNTRENKFVTTDAEGRFSFPPQDKRYTLAIVHDEGYAEVTDAQLADDSNIYLQQWGRVEGMVFVGGEPIGEMELTLEPVQQKTSSSQLPRVHHFSRTRTDLNGSFAFDRVVPAKVHQIGCVVELGVNKYSTQLTETVVVESGGTVWVDLGRQGRPVIGKVVVSDDSGELIDWSSSSNRLLTEDSVKGYQEGPAFKIEHDGTFRIEGVKAGRYNLQINLYEHRTDSWSGYREMIGEINHKFEVAEMEGGKSSEPLDIGTLELEIIERLKVGDIAPPLEGINFEGDRVRLSDYQDKVVLLVFWPKEVFENGGKVSQMKWICDSFGVDEQFVMIGIPVNSDFETARGLVKDSELGWTNCWLDSQAKEQMFDSYGKGGLPYTLVIGGDGKILGKNQTGQELELLLDKSLGQ